MNARFLIDYFTVLKNCLPGATNAKNIDEKLHRYNFLEICRRFALRQFPQMKTSY